MNLLDMWGNMSRLRLLEWKGEGKVMRLEGQAGPHEGKGPAFLLRSRDFILKGATEGF